MPEQVTLMKSDGQPIDSTQVLAGGGGGGGAVNSVTAGAGLVNSGTAADPILDVVAGDASIVVGPNSIQVSAAIQAGAALGATAVQPARTLTAGAGLAGGGDLSANRTFDIVAGDASIVINPDSIQVSAAIQAGAAAGATAVQPNTAPTFTGLTLTGFNGFLRAVVGVVSADAFGAAQQVPFMSAGATDYDYSANFTFNGSGIALTAASPFLTLTAANAAAAGELRTGRTFDFNVNSTADGDRAALTWRGATDRLTLGVNTGGTQAVRQVVIQSEVDLFLGQRDNTATMQFIGQAMGLTTVLAQTFTVNGVTMLQLQNPAAAVFGATVPVSGAPSYAGGTNPAASGTFRAANNVTALAARNAANSADLALVAVNASDVATFGNSTGATNVNSLAPLNLQTAGSTRFQLTSSSTLTSFVANLVFDNAVASPNIAQNTISTATVTGQAMTVHAQDCSGTTNVTAGILRLRPGNATGGSGTRNGGSGELLHGTGATSVGNWSLGVAAGNFQSMQGGFFVADRTAAPTGNPTSGAFWWSETGGLLSERTAAGDRITWNLTSANSASAGAASALPALPSEYITVTYNGNTRKIPCYAN